MRHFDSVEWLLYKNKLVTEERLSEMEEHLYNCDACMEIFISLIDEKEIEEAGNIVSEDFTESVLNSIENIRPIGKKREKKPKALNDSFLYYAAIASVTIILTAGGVFSSFVNSVPQVNIKVTEQENKINIGTIYSFTEQVTDMTAEFVNNLDFKIGKEE